MTIAPTAEPGALTRARPPAMISQGRPSGDPPREEPSVEPSLAAPTSLQNATAVAGLAGVASFTPSLLPRTRLDQGIVTAGSLLLGLAAGYATNKLADQVERASGLDALGSRVSLAGAGAATALAIDVLTRGNAGPALSAVRSAAIVSAAGSTVGAGLIKEREAAADLDKTLPGGRGAAHAAVFGAAAVAAGALLRVPFPPQLGRAASSLDEIPPPFDKVRHALVERERAALTTLSGGEGSFLPRSKLNKDADKFFAATVPGAEITRVLGEPAKDPIRLYASHLHSDDPVQLADNVVRELDRLDAWKRKHIVVGSSSGSGHISPVATQAKEFLTRGDIATIGIQYNTKPSVQSLGKVPRGVAQTRDVAQAVSKRLAAMPAATRPKFELFGESMGAWVSQDVAAGGGAKAIQDLGVDSALWSGTPELARWRTEVLGEVGHRIDSTGLVGEFDNAAQFDALTPEQRERLRYVLLTHYDDPVSKFDFSVFWRRPEWLRKRAPGVSKRQLFMPGITGLQTAVDTKNGSSMVLKPGVFGRTAHDYRADMVPMTARTGRHQVSADQESGVIASLKQEEIARALR